MTKLEQIKLASKLAEINEAFDASQKQRLAAIRAYGPRKRSAASCDCKARSGGTHSARCVITSLYLRVF